MKSWSHYLLLAFWLICITFAGAIVLALALPVPLPDPESACRVYDRFDKPIGLLQTEYREPIPLQQAPSFLVKAIIAVEDQDFFHHQGFSPRGALRAFFHDVRSGRAEQGGSTITQQLAKNLFLTQDRTIARKLKEAFYSLRLELHYSKNQILQAYLNQIYFGHGAYGIHAAARTYFSRDLPQLNRHELTLLAGLPKGPSLYSPYIHFAEANQRVDTVLSRMLETRVITPTDARQIMKEPLRLPGVKPLHAFAPFFMDYVRREASRLLHQPLEQMDWNNLRIETTLDPTWQQAAENSLRNRLALGRVNRSGVPQPQGALIALDPADGSIRAMVGGTDYQKSSYNRAVDSRRQPGSAFKPLLYLAALESGFTLSSRLPCEPLEIRLGNQVYRPTDHGSQPYHNRELSLREALSVSCNVVSVRLHEKLGRETLVRMAQRLGVRSPLLPLPSLALGSSEVSPLELATAYCSLDNGGQAVTAHVIRRILTRDGRTVWAAKTGAKLIFDPRLSFLITSALQDVVKPGGTAPTVASSLSFPIAGKTGTSESSRDAWFAGYTPYMVAVVYVGDDENRPLPGGGGQIAAPIWTDFARQVHRKLPLREFEIPTGVTAVDICSETGMLATPFCPRMTEYYLSENAPTTYCVKHRRFTLRVCSRSGLLPNPYCRQTEEREFDWGDQPTAICDICHPPRNFWEWLFGPSPRHREPIREHRRAPVPDEERHRIPPGNYNFPNR